MDSYEIAFSGRLLPGVSPETAKINLAQLFQVDEQRIAALFSGRRMVIKSGLDATGAERYRRALERAGALVEVCPQALEEIELAPPPAPVEETASSEEPRDSYVAAFADVQAPDFAVAPLGADMQEKSRAPLVQVFDFSDYSLAPLGSDMGQVKTEDVPPPPDVSHLRLQE